MMWYFIADISKIRKPRTIGPFLTLREAREARRKFSCPCSKILRFGNG